MSRDAGNEDFGLRQKQIDLPGRDGQVIRRLHGLVRRAEHQHGAYGNQDVPIGGRLAAIDHGVDQAGGHGNHRAAPQGNGQIDARHGGDRLRPGTRRVDHHLSADLLPLAGREVDDLRAHYGAALRQDPIDLVAKPHLAAGGTDGLCQKVQQIK